MLGQLKDKRGYSHREIMWGTPWAILLLEMADAPRYVRGNKPAPVAESAEDLKRMLNR